MNEAESRKENSFRSILKGTSIFGGVQIFNILISAIRLKFVAVILGPAGMGVAALFNSVSLTIQQFTSLGLNLAVVKEIGASKESDERLNNVLSALRPLIAILALAGALVCLLIPGVLSDITFGNTRYKTSFQLLSAAIFFSIVGTALMSVLQGLHEVKRLSKASLIGSIVGLGVGVPLYWLWGTDGIVPAMIALALSTCLWYYLSLHKSLSVSFSPWKKHIHLPILKRIMVMGLILMSNDLIKSLVNYMINIYIRHSGGMDDVGFYQSCNTMTAQYSAIVFTAMAMDYLPRLSAGANDNAKMCQIVNRQIEVVGLLIAPIVCTVIFLAPWVIELLQTKNFLTATPLLRLLAFAVVIRALMYPLGYIAFAKDNRRLFFWMESVGANLLTLSLAIAGYHFFSLIGLGIAVISDCIICLIVYTLVNHKLYGYKPTSHAARISLMALLSGSLMSIICFNLHGIPMTISAIVILATVGTYSYKNLIKLWKE